ncbi:MAG: succinylglutamate desuccinylase/aspartoacylase family protein [Planctomycetes bacterium]|nr:succinylglutamate desuccinylase/aspartoacylase family protein [Planctomycetota bacterium]MCB9869165.1 succinylglutamate desuccinylase/aspartoacylase family protein [Planctomycetota bacterium]MCB9889000.1 succinylglutamate desuccinylase/aspartoacylase family protein [Planctomycetota bacterium]
MSSLTAGHGSDTRTWRRILGIHDTGIPGPTLVALGGIHGNEPAGVDALLRVLDRMRSQSMPLRGRLVALAGNLEALGRGQRYVDRDLNRAWLWSNVEQLLMRDPALDCAEDREQRELVEVLGEVEQAATGPMVFLDLHTSSSDGPSFTCISDTLANRRVAMAIPVPLILGLEECIDGAVMEYFNRRGMVAVAVEGGRHDAVGTVDNLEAAVWLALHASGMTAPADEDLARWRATLARAAQGLPPVVEVTHRQNIVRGERFVMEPGFQSFDCVARGQLLARSNGEAVTAAAPCRLILPLYQGQGDDGFFLIREVRPFWLWVARVLRRLRLQEIVHWLPGVRRDSLDTNTLIVNRRVARVLADQIFHLLGFRKRREVNGQLLFSRRPDPDLASR